MRIGENIKFYRLQAKLTQQELADILETAQGHIGQIERGGRNPSLEMLYRIAEVLKCSAADLLSENDGARGCGQTAKGDTIIIEHGEGAEKVRIELPATPDTYTFLAKQLALPAELFMKDKPEKRTH